MSKVTSRLAREPVMLGELFKQGIALGIAFGLKLTTEQTIALCSFISLFGAFIVRMFVSPGGKDEKPKDPPADGGTDSGAPPGGTVTPFRSPDNVACAGGAFGLGEVVTLTGPTEFVTPPNAAACNPGFDPSVRVFWGTWPKLAALLLGLSFLFAPALVACSGSQKADTRRERCPDVDLAKIDAEFLAKATAACKLEGAGYDSCKAIGPLRDEHRARVSAWEECRK